MTPQCARAIDLLQPKFKFQSSVQQTSLAHPKQEKNVPLLEQSCSIFAHGASKAAQSSLCLIIFQKWYDRDDFEDVMSPGGVFVMGSVNGVKTNDAIWSPTEIKEAKKRQGQVQRRGLAKGKDYDLPPTIAQKLIDRGLASKDMPVKKLKAESEE